MAVAQSRSSPSDKITPAGAGHKIGPDDSKLAPAEIRPAGAEIRPAGAEIRPAKFGPAEIRPAGAKIRPAGAEIRPAGTKCGAGPSVLPKTTLKASNRIHSRLRAWR